FDQTNGGFGSQPKFPHPTELSLFLRHYRRSGDTRYLKAAELALQNMAHGGVYDQIGGGFHRYATDSRWLVPHFEKMLYDNALLVPVYAEAYQITKNQFYLKVIRETLDFILREMTDPQGGFYSALDADSEGEEGKFYVWKYGEIETLLGEQSETICKYYNITPGGNFEGHNILNITGQSDRIVQGKNPKEFEVSLEKSKKALLQERSKRIRPHTDDKILTSWNGLALSAFCRGYQVTGEKRFLEAAIKCATFIRKNLYKNRELTHSYREGVHSNGQFLEDYSFFIRGLIDLYESDKILCNDEWMTLAQELADDAVKLFADANGKFYLRPDGQDDLLFRPKEERDGAIPAAGS
ncbi:MAG: thioredoxin domain-containing protein, partial [Candidatus Zixiibacteriota bacterium]